MAWGLFSFFELVKSEFDTMETENFTLFLVLVEIFSLHSIIEFTFLKLKKAEKTPRYCLLNRKKAQISMKLSENLIDFPFFLACA